MVDTASNLSMAKYSPSLTAEQATCLEKLAGLDMHSFNESDVREEFLVPLIGLLGYERNSDYAVLREESYGLHPLFLTVGSKRIKLDYQFSVYKAGFWLLEAKKAQCDNKDNPTPIAEESIEQAHFYAHHRDIDCPLFGVSNGWWTNLYDRDAEEPSKPLLSIFHAELPKRFRELQELIGASQVTFWIKRRLIRRIEQVLSADIDLARADQFIREARMAASRAYPKVLENFRRNARIRDDTQSREFSSYIESTRPYDALDTVLMWPMNMKSIWAASDILSRKVAEFPGSNQFMFFNKLIAADARPVTIDYYINAFYLLAALRNKGKLTAVNIRGGGKADTPIELIITNFTRMLLFHFEERPDLRVLWAMEGLLKRMVKRALLSNQTARSEIAAGVEFQRYFQPEEEIAFLGPSPARSLVQVVESVTLAELGTFFSRHCAGERNQKFDVRSAVEEFHKKRAAFEPLEEATDVAYRKLAKSLGQEWSELTWSDHLNRTWDRLGHAICEALLAHSKILEQLPDDCRARLVELGRLGNSFARKCGEKLGIEVPPDYPDIGPRLKAIFTSL